MTQSEFNEMMNNYLQEVALQDASSWSEAARTWAESMGIIQGDENGYKMYKKPVTREELVQVLQRYNSLT